MPNTTIRLAISKSMTNYTEKEAPIVDEPYVESGVVTLKNKK